MFDNIMLIVGAVFTAFLGVIIVAMNSANAVGPYFIAGLCFLFSALSVRITVKYWKVA